MGLARKRAVDRAAQLLTLATGCRLGQARIRPAAGGLPRSSQENDRDPAARCLRPHDKSVGGAQDLRAECRGQLNHRSF
jgi:hypothetical protein